MYKFWNNILVKIFASLAVMLLLLSSCGSITHGSSNSNRIDSVITVETDTTVALFSSYDNPCCHLHSKFDVPFKATSQNTLDAAQLMIISLANEEYVNQTSSVEEMIKMYSKSYILEYLEEGMKAISREGYDVEETADWMNYEERCRGKVLYNDNNIFSYSVRIYSFSGGAHGNNTNNVASLDLRSNSVITLDYLFSKDSKENVRDLIVDALNKEYQLLTDEIDVVSNFYLSDAGITFVYNPLDIAAYSDGEIRTTLSWETLSPYLQNNPMQ